jgi:hypothetical protein
MKPAAIIAISAKLALNLRWLWAEWCFVEDLREF